MYYNDNSFYQMSHRARLLFLQLFVTYMQDRLKLAVFAAQQAGKVTLEYFQSNSLKVERKADHTPVTQADKNSELRLREIIGQSFPDDGILGEEFPEKEGTSGFRWILDPIDGTKSFIHGVPLYGTLIGIEKDGVSLIGVIHIPATGETVFAATGSGCWYTKNGSEPVQTHVNQVSDLSNSLFLTSEVNTFDEINGRDIYRRMEKSFYLTRTWGDCYGYLLVATGRAECMLDPVMSLWDAAALLPVIVEAGGTFTDFNGKCVHNSGNTIATNGLIHDQVLKIVRNGR